MRPLIYKSSTSQTCTPKTEVIHHYHLSSHQLMHTGPAKPLQPRCIYQCLHNWANCDNASSSLASASYRQHKLIGPEAKAGYLHHLAEESILAGVYACRIYGTGPLICSTSQQASSAYWICVSMASRPKYFALSGPDCGMVSAALRRVSCASCLWSCAAAVSPKACA